MTPYLSPGPDGGLRMGFVGYNEFPGVRAHAKGKRFQL